MDQLLNASKAGDLNSLYEAIGQNPYILVQIKDIPFVNTPLHIAASYGHIEFAMEIMRLKPSLARKSNQDGFSPIHLALQQEHMELVLRLTDLDAELVRVKGREGVTPLHHVVHSGNLDLLSKFLSVCPQSIEDLTIRNETALHIALKNNKLEAFKLLIDSLLSGFQDDDGDHKRKRILNLKDLDGNNLLHIISSQNKHQALELLLKCNSSYPGVLELEAVNHQTLTAFQLAHNFNHIEVQRSLQKAGVEQVATLDTANISTSLKVAEEDQNSVVSRNGIYNWAEHFKFDFGSFNPNQTRTDLLVVAILMATATFQAGLSPPGGVGDDKKALLAESAPFAYISFMIFNTAGFHISLHIIGVLLYDYPLFWDLCVASFAIVVTYGAAIASISPQKYMRPLFAVLNFLIPALLPFVSYQIRKSIKRRRRSDKDQDHNSRGSYLGCV